MRVSDSLKSIPHWGINEAAYDSNGFAIVSGRLISCKKKCENIGIPNGITSIGTCCFAQNSIIKNVTLPHSCTAIEDLAFYGCENLNAVYAENVHTIGQSAFENCYKLENIKLSKRLKRIDEYAFEGCIAISFEAPADTYAEIYANSNDIYFSECSLENEKISVKSVTDRAKAAKKIKPMLNLNMLILGGSGTGKSRFFVKPNLLQCNTSYVITDPSGELVQSCGKMLERRGYEIKIFNIDDMTHSSNYNPIHYVYEDISKAKYDANAVIKMINAYMLNTKGEGAGGDPFWDDSAKMLLQALCFLLIETEDPENVNFAALVDLLSLAKATEDDKEKSDLDVMFEERAKKEPNALSVQYYNDFKKAAGKTMQSILISVAVRVQGFKLEKIRNLTCKDNIELDTLGDKPTALFIIIPSTDSTYNFLAAMMYTQLFDSLYRKAINHYHGRLPCHVRFILDEFANVGKIPDFEKILATCRKFGISAQIILQNLSQLKRLYEKSWEEIPGNCDTTIFLGGKDQTNNEYIMKELGKETIDTLSVNKTKSKQGSTSYNDGIMGRDMMTLDELATMPNNECLVLIRGLHPFRSEKYDLINHPRYNMLDEANPQRNTYYLADNIQTEEEVEIIDESIFSINDNDNKSPIENSVFIRYINT